MAKVMIDPGHAGSYFNRSPAVPEYYESNMTWALSAKLKTALEKRGIGAALTRQSKDEDVELTERGRRAKGYDLFLSIHSNAAASETPSAPWIIHYSPDDRVYIDEESSVVAHLLGPVISEFMGLPEPYYYTKRTDFDRDGNGLLDDEYYGVLFGAKSVGVPGVILEHGFHTNPDTARWLMKEENLDRLAEAEAAAVARYFGKEEGDIPMTDAERKEFDALKQDFSKVKELVDVHDDQIGVKWAYIDKNLPEWATPTVKKLVAAGCLNGGDKNSLELSYLMLRLLVIADRAGAFDGSGSAG